MIQSIKAEEFVFDGITYTIISEEEKTCRINQQSQDLGANVVIPETVENNGVAYTVTEIEKLAFEPCISMESIQIPATIQRLQYNAFFGCSNLTEVRFEDSADALYLVNSYSFEPNLFPDSPIKTVYIGRNFTGQNNSYSSPFYSLATLENIEFCKSSIEIKLHKKMFAKCTSLKNVTIPGNVSWSWDENDNIGYFTDGNDYDGIFSDCTALESVIVLSKVYSTSKNMFSGCSSLNSVSFPASLQNIAARTFLGCTSLTKINLKHWNITTIGEAAFSNCNGLEVVQIPNTVTTLMRGAFMNCSKLKCVILPDRLTTLAIDVFKNSTSIEEVYYLTDNLTMGDRYTFEPSPTYGKATLYLRKSVLEKVETIEPWRNFVKKRYVPRPICLMSLSTVQNGLYGVRTFQPPYNSITR